MSGQELSEMEKNGENGGEPGVTEKTIYRERRESAARYMEDNALAFLFAGRPKQKNADMDFPFVPDRNYYYMTGCTRPDWFVVLQKLDGVYSEWMFISRPDPYFERYHGKMPDIEEVKAQTGAENVCYLDRFEWEFGRLLSRNYFEYLYFDFHKRELDTTAYPENDMAARLTAMYPCLRVKSLSRQICNMRRVKNQEEIACIEKAIELTGRGIRSILDHLRPGVNEREMQAYFEFELKMGGADGSAFNPIVAGGKNSVYLHYEENDQDVGDGDLLLLDLGAEYGYYAADISRTFPVNGKFTPEQRLYYEAVLYAQEKLTAYLRPGADVEKTLDVAREAIGEKLLAAGRIASMEEMTDLLPHGVCHYVGLDCHDVGDRGLLEPGMIVTMEPGVYLPDLGFGIRVEDDVLITEDGCRVMSAAIPRTVEEVEAYMAARKER